MGTDSARKVGGYCWNEELSHALQEVDALCESFEKELDTARDAAAIRLAAKRLAAASSLARRLRGLRDYRTA